MKSFIAGFIVLSAIIVTPHGADAGDNFEALNNPQAISGGLQKNMRMFTSDEARCLGKLQVESFLTVASMGTLPSAYLLYPKSKFSDLIPASCKKVAGPMEEKLKKIAAKEKASPMNQALMDEAACSLKMTMNLSFPYLTMLEPLSPSLMSSCGNAYHETKKLFSQAEDKILNAPLSPAEKHALKEDGASGGAR